MRGHRPVAAVLLALGTVLLTVSVLPLYVFGGVGEGSVSLTGYRLVVFNETVRIPFLDKVVPLGYGLLVQSLYTVFSALLLLLRPGRVSMGLSLSAAFAGYIAAVALAYGGGTAGLTLSRLPRVFRYVSSAGSVDLGELVVEETPLLYLANPLVPVALATTALLLSLWTEFPETGHPPAQRDTVDQKQQKETTRPAEF